MFVDGLFLSKQMAPTQLPEVGCIFWLFCGRVARAEALLHNPWSLQIRVKRWQLKGLMIAQ